MNNDDIPSDTEGWKINRRQYSRKLVAPGDRSADDVYTRHTGYVPYQSVVQDGGHHAYDPHGHQDPQSNDVGYAHAALDPIARRREFMQNRSGYYAHLPGEQVVMGIDENRMRTQPMPAAAMPQPGGQPVQQPQQPIQQQPIQQQPIQQQPIQRQPIQQRPIQLALQWPMPSPTPPPTQQPVRNRPLRPRPLLPPPAPLHGRNQGPVRVPTQGPVRGAIQGPVRGTPGPVRGAIQGPVLAHLQGPMRGHMQGPPRGALGTRGGMPALPQTAGRGRGADPMPRPARGGYGNARGNRSGRR